MAGLGTGCVPHETLRRFSTADDCLSAAPFRAFLQEREWQRNQGIDVGPLVYYFGSRYRSKEYLYGCAQVAHVSLGTVC
jgi:hypothetical protein